MSFLKHGDLQPITHVLEAPEVIEEAAKEALEKVKEASQEEKLIYKSIKVDVEG